MPDITSKTQAHIAVSRRAEDDLACLRSLSLADRGRPIPSVCRAVARIEKRRTDNGLPPVEPAPWPVSMLELMKRHARNASAR